MDHNDGYVPDGVAEPPPELSEMDRLRADNKSLRYQIERARWALATDEPVNEELRQAEIRAAVAEHEAEAYRNQVQALVRAVQRERGIPEDELGGEAFVVVVEQVPPPTGIQGLLEHVGVLKPGQPFTVDSPAQERSDIPACDEIRRLRCALSEALAEFRFETHPGQRCKQTGHVPVATVERWRGVLGEASTSD